MTEIEFPEIPLFDRRRTRWAVARGLFRTAVLVLLSFALLSLLAAFSGNILLNSLDRDDDLKRVGLVGYQVGHPGLDLHQGSGRVGSLHAESALTGTTEDGLRIDVPLRVGIFGSLNRPPTQLDPLDRTILGRGAGPAEARAFLRQLPAGVEVDAVVQLAQPVHTAEVAAIGDARWPAETVFYSPVFGAGGGFDSIARPVTWSARYHVVGLGDTPFSTWTSFAGWTRSLKSSDDENLRTLDLPSSEELQRLAQADLVYAVYLRNQTPQELAALLKNPLVRSFTPSAVRFALPAQASIQ